MKFTEFTFLQISILNSHSIFQIPKRCWSQCPVSPYSAKKQTFVTETWKTPSTFYSPITESTKNLPNCLPHWTRAGPYYKSESWRFCGKSRWEIRESCKLGMTLLSIGNPRPNTCPSFLSRNAMMFSLVTLSIEWVAKDVHHITGNTFVFISHTGAKIHILSENSHFENFIFSQNSHF